MLENLACRLTEIESKATNWPIKFKYNDASSIVAEKKLPKNPLHGIKNAGKFLAHVASFVMLLLVIIAISRRLWSYMYTWSSIKSSKLKCKSFKVSWMCDFGPFAKHVLSVHLKTSHHISAKLPNYFIHTINQTFVEKKDTSWHKFFKSGCKIFLIFRYLDVGNSPLMKGNEWLNIGFGMCVIVSCLVGAGRVVVWDHTLKSTGILTLTIFECI